MSRDEDSRRTPTIRPSSYPPPPVNEEDGGAPEASSRTLATASGVRRLGEDLTPLIQYLHKNLGRPWNDVCDGLSSVVAPGSAAHKQLFEHVSGLVATTVVVLDGKPHRIIEGGVGQRRLQVLTGSKWDSLYVCPRTGALRSASRPQEPARRVNPDVKPVGPLSQYRRINGVWYFVELAYIPSVASPHFDAYDVLLHARLSEISSEDLRRLYGAYDRYAVAKRPLTKRELLRLSDVLES